MRTTYLMIDMENIAFHLKPLSFAFQRQEACLNGRRNWDENAILHDDGTGDNRSATGLITNQISRLQIIIQTEFP